MLVVYKILSSNQQASHLPRHFPSSHHQARSKSVLLCKQAIFCMKSQVSTPYAMWQIGSNQNWHAWHFESLKLLQEVRFEAVEGWSVLHAAYGIINEVLAGWEGSASFCSGGWCCWGSSSMHSSWFMTGKPSDNFDQDNSPARGSRRDKLQTIFGS